MADFNLENPTFDPDGHGIDNDKSFDPPDAIMDPLPLWGRVAQSVPGVTNNGLGVRGGWYRCTAEIAGTHRLHIGDIAERSE